MFSKRSRTRPSKEERGQAVGVSFKPVESDLTFSQGNIKPSKPLVNIDATPASSSKSSVLYPKAVKSVPESDNEHDDDIQVEMNPMYFEEPRNSVNNSPSSEDELMPGNQVGTLIYIH